MKEQEYYYNGTYVTIWGEVKDKPGFVIVDANGDFNEFSVVRKSELVEKEKSYMYTKAEERAAELRAITAKAQENFDELVEKVIDEATTSLQTRMKLNAIFGSDTAGSAGWAVLLADELKKLVKEKAPKVVKGQ